MLLNLDEKDYYLVYEKSGIQDWVFLGLVQADIVNASMNTLQLSTMLLVGAVVLCPYWIYFTKKQCKTEEKRHRDLVQG